MKNEKCDRIKVKIMKNYLSSLISHLSSPQKGFTLIELMIVLSVTAVLGTLGIAGFTSFNQTQILQTSANEVVTMLNLAKSRALSQVKLGSSCSAPSQILEGYNVDISITNNSYTLSSRCFEATNNLDTKTLPQNVTFETPDTFPTSFFFPVLSGGAQKTPGKIVITGFGRNKTIIVNSLGGVSIQ